MHCEDAALRACAGHLAELRMDTEQEQAVVESLARAALAKVEGGNVLREEDLKVETWRAPGITTQIVQTNPNPAVRITHVPTGITATCQDHMSQIKNKEQALRELRAKWREATVASFGCSFPGCERHPSKGDTIIRISAKGEGQPFIGRCAEHYGDESGAQIERELRALVKKTLGTCGGQMIDVRVEREDRG
jgi:RF-1 domain